MATCRASRERCPLFLRKHTRRSQAASLCAQSGIRSPSVHLSSLPSAKILFCQPSRCTGSIFLLTVPPACAFLAMPQAYVDTLLPWPGEAACSTTEVFGVRFQSHLHPRHPPSALLSAGGCQGILVWATQRAVSSTFALLLEASRSSRPPVLRLMKTKFKIRIFPLWGLQQDYG